MEVKNYKETLVMYVDQPELDSHVVQGNFIAAYNYIAARRPDMKLVMWGKVLPVTAGVYVEGTNTLIALLHNVDILYQQDKEPLEIDDETFERAMQAGSTQIDIGGEDNIQINEASEVNSTQVQIDSKGGKQIIK